MWAAVVKATTRQTYANATKIVPVMATAVTTTLVNVHYLINAKVAAVEALIQVSIVLARTCVPRTAIVVTTTSANVRPQTRAICDATRSVCPRTRVTAIRIASSTAIAAPTILGNALQTPANTTARGSVELIR